ncbi:MAG: manganese-dependent inorganic pyrophosphatase [Candidatus Colwellbacteria bacterium]|jgi:manganese-dependent inorganic pyrophosphatase|nr:manganese-dependent inorganic pyrophosphatase [Candidatus Colwellbacteria bacterium]MCK9497518.1 manganese-dependent inorganic pyrophosphatase [Candidatus Colwellbacteria bacterium]MDD3752446.1 manganese-dependent inorganic pyrophosphatase [Candidatus Colwellbacteria bacterium]MDD4818684.1 manganese-dependent inorganic pyrophosphatase [Candidatus Colwellbacteria bacterium]
MKDIYVIGHKNPDTDSVVSAIACAKIMDYKPAIAGDINKETDFILKKFGVSVPEKLENISGKQVFLVDHNENTQIADGWDSAEIVGVLDHHKINFSSLAPLFFHAEPLGATSSIIAKLYMEKIRADASLAGILLSGILSDTVVFKSPTTTEDDKKIAEELASIAGIGNIEEFGVEIKKAGADISGRSVSDIVEGDFKEFNMGGKKIGIGQVELPDISVIENIEDDIIALLNKMKENKYEMAIMAITDIMNEGSKLLFSGDKNIIEKAFSVRTENNKTYIKGLMSRKKQLVPPLEKILSE